MQPSLKKLNNKLLDAAKKGDVDTLNDLIKQGADVNTQKEYYGWNSSHLCKKTPLHYACKLKDKDDAHLEIVKILLNNGANPNIKDDTGNTPLHNICNCYNWYKEKGGYSYKMKGNYDGHIQLEIVKLLLDNGADSNLRNNFGSTPLMKICDRDDYNGQNDYRLEIVKLLLNKAADPKSIAHIISTHYETQISKLTPAEAELWGEYAFIHIADLFMSGVISGSQEESLPAEQLGEEAVLWLSYVPTRQHAPRITVQRKVLSLKDNFLLPKIAFKDNSKENTYTCCITIKDDKGRFISQNESYPPRWATERELVALTNLWDTPHSNRHQALQSNAKIQHRLIFDDKAILKLKPTSFPLETKKTLHLSKSKRIKKLEHEMGKIQFWKNKESEETKKEKFSSSVKNMRHRSASF